VIFYSEEAAQRLRQADETMSRLVDGVGAIDEAQRVAGRPADAYGALVRSIVGQQLSTKAARAIYGRLLELFGGKTPTPQRLLDADPEAIRAAGLSRPKVGYLRSLAEHVISGDLDLEHFDSMSDEEVTREITAVKGLGQWSADMFLMFHLGRPDVLPVGDLGVRRAVQRAYGLETMPSAEELEALGERWRPYRSLASLYLWHSLGVVPD
jgi:DNA-3-methyladenine glycosylase II